MSVDCVVDASVAIKLFLIEPLAGQADALFAALAEIQVHVSMYRICSISSAQTY